MILLTAKERQQLREVALNASRQVFDKYSPSEKRAHWNRLDRVIESIMLNHPEAFTVEAIDGLKEKLHNQVTYARY